MAADIDPFNEVENGGISAQIDVDYDNFILTSITSQRFSDTFEALDIDMTSAPLTQTNPNDLNVDTFTQEIRLTSAGDGNLNWMVGAFYFEESVDYTSEVLWGPQARNYFDLLVAGMGAPGALAATEVGFGMPAGTFFANGTGPQDSFTQDDQSTSLFGQFDWQLNEQLTLTAGFNYTEAKKEVTVSQVNTHIFGSLPAGLIGGLAALQAALPPVVNLPNAIEGNTTDDSDTTYTLRLAYDVNDNVNIYGSYATGFKASSWNLSRDSGPNSADLAALQAAGLTANAPNLSAGSRFADPEESEVYELGLKAMFERGSFNMAIFDQTIKGFQSSIFNGTGFELLNAGMQSTKGIEFDLVYYPVESLRLGFAGTLLDPLYDKFVDGGFEGADLSGTKPAGIHEVSLSFSALYDFRLGTNDAYARADYQYADEVIIVDNIPSAVAAIATREVGSLNLSAGMNTQSDLNLSIWARNVTNDEYMTSGFPTPAQEGSFNIYPNLPRTFGVTLRKSF